MTMQSVSGRRLPKIAFAAALLCLLWGSPASAQAPTAPPAAVQPQQAKSPAVQPAIGGILDAFKTHPIVAMADYHGLAQQQDFYGALVRDPHFAREVGHVVVEFGAASHQAIIDRYVAGENVPYADLRKVWSDAVGWTPTVTYVGFANFFAHVRAANLALPPGQRIRVWLGDPPVDWATAAGRDVQAALSRRDRHAAEVVVDNILSKGRKALVIYGAAHLVSDTVPGSRPRSAPNPGAEAALRKLLADTAKGTPDYAAMTPQFAEMVRGGLSAAQADIGPRGAVTGVTFVSGDDAGRDRFAIAFAASDPITIRIRRNAQGLLTGFERNEINLRDAVELRYPNSFFLIAPYEGYVRAACSERVERDFERNLADWPLPALATSVRGSALEAALRAPGCAARDVLDGFLYLGPAAGLMRSPILTDLYLDQDFRAEIARRQPLRRTQPVPLAVDMAYFSAASRTWRFSIADRNSDGRIDKPEYKSVLDPIGQGAQLDRLFAQHDINKDSFLSMEEHAASVR